MAIDRSSLITQLTALTGDLQPWPGSSAKQLEEARALVTQAIAAGQIESPILTSSARPSPAAQLLSAEVKTQFESLAETTLSHPPPAPLFLVARREVPLDGVSVPDFTPEWTNGRAVDQTLGPFLDSVGRPVWIDVFNIVRQFSLVRTSGGAPFLSLPLQGLLITGNKFKLPAGSVWIASQQLAPAAPASSYTGLRILGGTLAFSQNLSGSGNEIVVPLATTCTLSLNLDPGTAPAGSGAGEDARLSTAAPPKAVTIVFSSAGAKIQSVGKASVTVYGSTTEVDPTTNPLQYVASVARIFVPATTTAASFSIADVRSDQFEPSGTAPIDTAAWALPVAVVSAAALGNASGAGGLALVLKDGLTLTWKGQSNAVPAGPVMLIVDPGVVSVMALTAQGLGSREIIPLWSSKPGDSPSSQLELSWPAQFPLRFFSSSAGSELLLSVGSLRGNFDRPITVAGNRVFVQSHLALIVFIESAVFTGMIVEAVLDPPPAPVNDLAFAIANAVFRTTPARTLLLAATWDGTQARQGGLAVGFGFEYLLPILPDPYAANISLPEGRVAAETSTAVPIFAIVLWNPANVPLLTYLLPPGTTALGLASVLSAAPQTQIAAVTASATTIGQGALILLDLSTNVDQFGVGWRSATRDKTASQNLIVDSMYLESPSDAVYVLTLPAVQWEPVFTESPPAFPSPLTFANSGGPTSITVQSVQLVRIAPAPALDNLVLNFGASESPQPALARLTLPFGIEAFSTWNKPGVIGPAGAAVNYNRPNFPSESVVGGYQISVQAVDPAAPDSPSLQGYTIQLRNGLFSGVPANKSVLDDQVDTIFNGYLGSAGLRPQVPVTRFDLSGYGESLFSNWLNQTDDPVAVSQARFDVLIGRSAYEVIQVRSVLYPYGVRVVRTITIDRKNSASVVRKDSGWQAVSDGEYLFPGVGLTTHPGVVQKISNVTNIRDTGQMIDVGGGAQVAGVLFDGDLTIEGVTKGASASGVPARDQIGYVQLTPASSGSLLPSQYQTLINTAGPLGGTIDCVLNIDGSGQLMKLGRIGVGVTQGMGGPEFVMTAWGSPQFPQGGQWSFLKQTGAGTAPEVVEQDLGVPLIRSGPAPATPPITSPYRFADPVDLATPDTPASDYGIVHATGTQRVFFPRPKIEATAPDRITSTQAPVLADPYSLATAVGFFPRTDSAIPFPSSTYALVIAGGNYRLQMPSPNFPVTVGQRTIAEAGSVKSYADYTGSTAVLSIDTSQPVPWSFQLQNVNIASSSGLLGEVVRVTSTVDAAANLVTSFKNSKIIFGGALGVIQDVLEFLQTLGFPSPLGVAMTNKITLKAGLRIPMDAELNKLMPPGGPEFDDTDVVVSIVIASPVSEVDFEMGATLLIPTPFDPLKAVGMFTVEISLSTDSGTTLTLTAGAGVGVGFNIGPFDCKAYFLLTLGIIIGDNVLGLAVGVLIKGTVDLEIVEAHVIVEAKMAVLKVTCPQTTIYGAAQVTFAIEVHICFVIDIDFEVQAELDKNLNGGPCALPDVL